MIAWTLQWWDQNLTVWLKLFCTCIILDFEITWFFLSLFTLFNFVCGIYDLMIWLSSVVALFRFDFRVPLAGGPPAPNRYMCTSFYWTIIPHLSQYENLSNMSQIPHYMSTIQPIQVIEFFISNLFQSIVKKSPSLLLF